LFETWFGVWLRRRKHFAGKDMVGEYEAWLGIVKIGAMRRSLTRLRLLYRSPEGEPWPDEVKERLDTLEEAVNEIILSKDEQQDYIRTQNALIELQNAYETFEPHGLSVPQLLDEIQVDLVRARNALDPNQEHGRSP
jgi:hypothetical protein